MIITLTESANGQRRIYLGGKSSLECFISPKPDNIGWTIHLEDAVGGIKLSEIDRRSWAVLVLKDLARELRVHPSQLPGVAFGTIAALHTGDPFLSRRVPSPKRRVVENGYTAVGPSSDFSDRIHPNARDRRL